jgi:hypothetical protein
MELIGRHLFGRESGLDPAQTYVNRSVPIMAATLVFERVSRDPQPISVDLTRMCLSKFSLYSAVRGWHRFLTAGASSTRRRGGGRGPSTGSPSASSRTRTLGTAGPRAWLKREDAAWKRWLGLKTKGEARERVYVNRGRWRAGLPPLDRPPSREPEPRRLLAEDLDAAVKPAFGFWMFPPEVFGPVGESGLLPLEHSPEEGEGHQLEEVEGHIVDRSMHWP